MNQYEIGDADEGENMSPPCPKCGEEMTQKLLGDEWYWVCNECGQSQ